MAIKHKKVDVVTVGAGWTASMLAWRLTQAGHEVVSIERGPWRWANPDFEHNHDSIRYAVRKAMMQNLARESWTWRPNKDAPALPMRQYGAFHPGAGVGGAAVHWSGMLWRFTPYDFRYRSHYLERYGEQKLPEGSSVQDWPISYEELEPYYDAFEYDIGSSGQAGNLGGALLEGGNPFEGPRRRPYPLPPLQATLPSGIFADACRRLGYHPFPQPSGILSQAYTDISGRTRSSCLYCGFCTRFGCEVDAKSSPQTTHLPLALASGRYEIRPNAVVTRINVGADGLATGISYVGDDGEEHEQPAELVVLSAYTLTNVRLLMLSQSVHHPGGVGNDREQLGRNCTHQMWLTPAQGVFDGRRFNLYMGNTSTVNVIYDFYGHVIDHSDLDFIGGSPIFSTLGERDPVTSAGDMPLGDGQNWGQPWKDALRKNWDNLAAITIQGESPAYDFHFYDLDPTYRDQFGLPLLRFTFDWTDNERKLYAYVAERCREIMQAMGPSRMDVKAELDDYDISQYKSTHMTGGAIMGSDPGNSVTNKFGQVWDTPNVFVTGAALYPQNAGANPTGTLSALAYMAADALVTRYFKRPNELLV